jgi:hypothetical protein
MKNNDYYIRILTNNDSYIGLSASKLNSLKDIIPEDNLVNEHLLAQSEVIRREGKKYEPIEITLPSNLIDEISNEIKKKVQTKKNRLDMMYLHFDLNTIPVIIIKERFINK